MSRPTLLAPACVVALASLLAYLPVLGHQFLELDDTGSIASNPLLVHPTREALAHYWTELHPHKEFYVPLNYTAWWAVAHAARTFDAARGTYALTPGPFHALNWLAHAAAGVMALGVLNRLVRNRWAACAGALLFVLHPVQAEPVSWATSMYSPLSGAFALLAVWQYLRYSDLRHGISATQPRGAAAEAPAPPPAAPRGRAWAAYLLATAAFAAAALTKPTVVVVPFMVAVLELFLRGRRLRDVVLPTGAWLVLVAPVVLLARASQQDAPLYVPSAPWRALVALDSLAFYLYKLVLPIRLAPDYGRSPYWLLNQSGQVYYTWPVAVFLGAVAWGVRRQAPWVLACVMLFVAALLPSLGLVPFDFQRYSTVGDRYLYLALMSVALALAWVLARHPRPASFAAASAGLVVLGAISVRQTTYWRDTDTLFRHTLAVNPRSLAAHSAYGYRYAAAGRPDVALAEYDQALQAAPGDPAVLALVGDVYMRQRKLPEAAGAYGDALARMPNNASLHINLGVTLAQLGQVDDAVRLLSRATEIEPRNAEARANLGTALSARQDWAGARRQYEEALRLDPASQTARAGLARVEAQGAGGPPPPATHGGQ